MVMATASIEKPERFELKSLEGAYVVLRRMTFGEVVQRRAMTKLNFTTQGKGKNSSFAGEIAMASKAVTMFEFENTIIDHNLEKEGPDGGPTKLNLASPVDFELLDPRAGQEIEQLISDMNEFDEDDEKN